MDETQIRQIIEQVAPGVEIGQDQLEELVAALTSAEKVGPITGTEINLLEMNDFYRRQMEEETDWRERARIAAKIISLGIDA